MWRHDFIVLRDVHSQSVYLQEESLPRFLPAIFYHIFAILIIFYLQLINSGHADRSMADKKRGKLSC